MRTMIRPYLAVAGLLALAALLALLHSRYPDLETSGWEWKEGREAMVAIHDGRLDDAVLQVERHLVSEPEDPEALFVLAVARARRGEAVAAAAAARRSLAAGLPFERFLAGPRDLLAPLTESAEFRRLALEPGEGRAEGTGSHGRVEILHGPLVGSVTSTSARFWVRTALEAPVKIRCWRQGGEGDGIVESPDVHTSASRDFTGVAEIRGLRPDTSHEYRVVVAGREDPATFVFRTFPAEGSRAKFSIAFGGGAAYTPQHERMFAVVAARRPLAFLQLGDNVYIDHPEKPGIQRYCYYRRQSSRAYRDLVAATCVAAIWDDHDFGTNDCRGGPEVDDPPWKRRVWDVFCENWNNPAYGDGAARPGCYFDCTIGDVQFILLDCRYYRTAPLGPESSMLGPVQKRWLLDRLAASEAAFKVIASSVPFSRGAKPGSADAWDGYPAEREEIFSFIAANRIEGVLLISADRHRSDARCTPRPGAYDLYEFESSRLTNIHRHSLVAGALFGYNEKCSFGMLSFDTTLEDPEVRFTIVSIDDEPVHELVLRQSQLRASK